MKTYEYLTELFFSAHSTIYALSLLLGTLALSAFLHLLLAKFAHTAGTKMAWNRILFSAVAAPLQLLIWVVGSVASLITYNGSDPGRFYNALNSMHDVGVIVSLAWFLTRFIKLSHQQYLENNLPGGQVDRTAVDAMAKLARLTVFVIAALVALQTLGFSIAGILTFGGVGGVAVGFAAKDLLANFFGGMMIYLDRPFAVGDWVCSADRSIEGSIENIGWRMTIIRKFDSRPLYVPNSVFSTIVVENPSRMTHRELAETIAIRHEDASALDNIVQQAQAYLEQHPDIDSERTVRVNFAALTPSSLELAIWCFTYTQDLMQFGVIKQQIMLHILGIIKANGAQCATPVATLNIKDNPVSRRLA